MLASHISMPPFSISTRHAAEFFGAAARFSPRFTFHRHFITLDSDFAAAPRLLLRHLLPPFHV